MGAQRVDVAPGPGHVEVHERPVGADRQLVGELARQLGIFHRARAPHRRDRLRHQVVVGLQVAGPRADRRALWRRPPAAWRCACACRARAADRSGTPRRTAPRGDAPSTGWRTRCFRSGCTQPDRARAAKAQVAARVSLMGISPSRSSRPLSSGVRSLAPAVGAPLIERRSSILPGRTREIADFLAVAAYVAPHDEPSAYTAGCPRRPDRRRARADPDPRRGDGDADPGARARRGRLHRARRLRDPRASAAGEQRPADPDPARGDRGDPLPLRHGGGGHHRDQHLFLDRRSRKPTTARRRWSTSSTAPAPRWCGGRPRAAEAKDGQRRFVAGALGPTNRTASISPDVERPGLSGGELRRPAHGLRRAAARPGRRRRGPDPDRDDLRHAERQGRDLRLRGGLRREAACGCR